MHGYTIIFALAATVICTACSNKARYSSLTDKPLPVEIEVVGESSRLVEDTYVGEIHPLVDISLVFAIPGRLTNICVKSGEKVKAGRIIASVDSTQAKSLLESAEAMYAQALDAYRRLKPIHEEGGISDVKWVEMETTLEKTRSMVISARKRCEDCTMRAPQDGVVSLTGVEVGEQVGIGQPIGKLMDLNAFSVEFTVPESEIGRLVVGQPVTVWLPAIEMRFNASIMEKAILSTHLAHTYRVKAEINDPQAADHLLPGMVCRAVITEREQNGFIISAGCIQTQQRGHSVWLLRNGRASRQMVKISEFVENGVLIGEGIALGDTIISKGYQKMYDGAAVTF